MNLPSPGTVADPLALLRALRTLRARLPGPPSDALDEAPTVDRITEEGVWEPIRRPTEVHTWSATVVIDDAPSMRLWRARMTDALRMLHHLRAFAGMRWAHLRAEGVSAGPPESLRRELPPEHPAPPATRRLTLVLTDGLDARWADGSAARAIKATAGRGTLALLNLLPYRLWPRTHLGRGALRRWRQGKVERDVLGERELVDTVFAPAIDLEPRSLRAWAQLAHTGTGAWPATLALSTVGRALPTPSPLTGAERVSRFRRSASPLSLRLSTLLAQADRVELPLARAIREACLPSAGFAEEVEVLLGGIFQAGTATDGPIELTMIPEAREVLRFEARRDDMPTLFKALGTWLAASPNVPPSLSSLLIDPETAAPVTLDPSNSALVTALLEAMRLAGGRWSEIAEQSVAFDRAAQEAWIARAERWIGGAGHTPSLSQRQAQAVGRVRGPGPDSDARPGEVLLFARALAAGGEAEIAALARWFGTALALAPSNGPPKDIPPRLLLEVIQSLDTRAPGVAAEQRSRVIIWVKRRFREGAGENDRALAGLTIWAEGEPPVDVDRLAGFANNMDANSGLAQFVAELYEITKGQTSAQDKEHQGPDLPRTISGTHGYLNALISAPRKVQLPALTALLEHIDRLVGDQAPEAPRLLGHAHTVGGKNGNNMPVWLRPHARIRASLSPDSDAWRLRHLAGRLDVLAPFPGGPAKPFVPAPVITSRIGSRLEAWGRQMGARLLLCPLIGAGDVRWAVGKPDLAMPEGPESRERSNRALQAAWRAARDEEALLLLPDLALDEEALRTILKLDNTVDDTPWVGGLYRREESQWDVSPALGVAKDVIPFQRKRVGRRIPPSEHRFASFGDLVEAVRPALSLNVVDTSLGRIAVVFGSDLASEDGSAGPKNGFLPAIREAGVDLLFVLAYGAGDKLIRRLREIVDFGCCVAMVSGAPNDGQPGVFYGAPWRARGDMRWVRWSAGSEEVETDSGRRPGIGRLYRVVPGVGLLVLLDPAQVDGPTAP